VQKALKDVLLAYEMNGEPLRPDHGYPVRLVVPDWIGISSIKWVGRIEVSDSPLASPWNTQYYRLFGPGYPANGELITKQNAKSAFELPWNGTLAAGRHQVLRGRSWSGSGGISRVEVSTDGGRTWRPTTPLGSDRGWHRWALPWRPPIARVRPSRCGSLQHPGLSVRRRGQPPGHRVLTAPGYSSPQAALWPQPVTTDRAVSTPCTSTRPKTRYGH
jgi:DMSO/TMAO reductase YedYZ molybdopterin-dependent catalytic subunit